VLQVSKKILIKMSAALAAAFLFAGCFQENGITSIPTDPSPRIESASMQIRMRVGSVSALGKGQTLSLSKLIVIMTSNASPADTIRDTIKAGVSQGFVSTSTANQTIDSSYALKALRSWKIKVTVRDSRDSVIHSDSASTPVLRVRDTATVNLSLVSLFSMYDAKFLSLPDSITSATGNLKQVLRVDRLVLKVDGVTVRDSMATPGPYFAPSTLHTLSYDYVRLGGSRVIEMNAYGPMGGSNTPTLLYSGTKTVTANPGIDSTVSVTLNWVGPTTGSGKITATLSRVGKVTITGKLPGTP
jgi:hypothetical protein